MTANNTASAVQIDPLSDYRALDFALEKGAGFWDMFIPFDGAPLITADERDDLITRRYPVEVVEVRMGKTAEYGDTWFITLAHDLYGDLRYVALPMSPNVVRDRQLRAMYTYLNLPENDRKPVVCIIEAFTASNGLKAYRLAQPEQVMTQATVDVLTQPPF